MEDKEWQRKVADINLMFFRVSVINQGAHSRSDDLILNHLKKFITKSNCKNFLDLGSGSGYVVCYASYLGLKATGIEIDEKFYQISQEESAKAIDTNLIKKVELVKGDFFDFDLQNFDLIYHYQTYPADKIVNLFSKKAQVGAYLFLVKSVMGEKFSLPPNLKIIQVFEEIDIYQKI